jgi:hypothetical protein
MSSTMNTAAALPALRLTSFPDRSCMELSVGTFERRHEPVLWAPLCPLGTQLSKNSSYLNSASCLLSFFALFDTQISLRCILFQN